MQDDFSLKTAARAALGTPTVRIELPLNLDCWRDRSDGQIEILTWFHQHALDAGLTWAAAASALGFDSEDRDGAINVLRMLRGDYEGDWPALIRRVEDFQKIVAERLEIRHAEFRETPVSKMIWSGLDYALAAGCITVVEGDSGHGKTISQTVWMDTRSKGRAVRVEVPAIGGTSLFIEEIGRAIGYTRKYSASATREAIFNAFNEDRILIVDEATRLLPKGGGQPEKLEFLRELHDKKRAPLGLFATRRFVTEMEASKDYLFEQVLGRCMPIRLPAVLDEACWRPILVQFYPRPSKALCTAASELANNKRPRQKGRVRLLAEVLKLATRMAAKAKKPLVEEHFFNALALRGQMMGEQFGA